MSNGGETSRQLNFRELARATATRMSRLASFRVSAEGEAIITAFREAAEQNTMSSEARLFRYVRNKLNVVLPQLRRLECRLAGLSPRSPLRPQITSEIELIEHTFSNEIAYMLSRTRREIQERDGESNWERFLHRLPPYLQDSIERKGLVVPGIPGAFQPRSLNNPIGIKWGIQF